MVFWSGDPLVLDGGEVVEQILHKVCNTTGDHEEDLAVSETRCGNIELWLGFVTISYAENSSPLA